jgi:hypothetical protein
MSERIRAWLREHGKTVLVAVAMVLAMVFVLRLVNRPYICACGYVKLWQGMLGGPDGSSQHLFDPFSFAHALHGFVFFALLSATMKRRSMGSRVLVAILLEIAWEIFENGQFAIEGFRAATGRYRGDSVVNALGDVISMLLGFWAALRWSRRASIAAAAACVVLFVVSLRYGLFPGIDVRLFQAG